MELELEFGPFLFWTKQTIIRFWREILGFCMSIPLQRGPLSSLLLLRRQLDGRRHSHSRTVCITVWRPSVSSFLRFLGTGCVPLPIFQGLYCKYLDGVKRKARPPTWGWSAGGWAKGVLLIQKIVLSQEFTEGYYFCWVRFSSFIQETEDRREAGWVCIWDSREDKLVLLSFPDQLPPNNSCCLLSAYSVLCALHVLSFNLHNGLAKYHLPIL